MTMQQKINRGRHNAAAALAAYRAAHGTTGRPDLDDEACIGDLIADLLHLAQTLSRDELFSRLDAETIAARAVDHYTPESDPENVHEYV